MKDARRPAAYIRIARGGSPASAARPRRAALEAARSHGWPEPTVYLDDDGRGPGGDRAAITRLTKAIGAGRHDALLLVGVGTVSGVPSCMLRLLEGCTKQGVPVQLLTSPEAAWPPHRALAGQQGQSGGR